NYASGGTLAIKGLEWHDQAATVRGVGMISQFSVDPRKISLTKLLGQALGGAISGEGEILNWAAKNAAGTPKPKSVEAQKGSFRLKFKDISVTQAAAAIPPSRLPVARMNLAGSADGTLEVHWLGGWRNAESIFAIDVDPPARVSPSQLAIRAHARGAYRAA